MGIQNKLVSVANTNDPKKRAKMSFVIDSGALHSVVSKRVLKKLGVNPIKSEDYVLANGDIIIRMVGVALFEYQGEEALAPVIFGEIGDKEVLGATTLESMGLGIDPIRQKLINVERRL